MATAMAHKCVALCHISARSHAMWHIMNCFMLFWHKFRASTWVYQSSTWLFFSVSLPPLPARALSRDMNVQRICDTFCRLSLLRLYLIFGTLNHKKTKTTNTRFHCSFAHGGLLFSLLGNVFRCDFLSSTGKTEGKSLWFFETRRSTVSFENCYRLKCFLSFWIL